MKIQGNASLMYKDTHISLNVLLIHPLYRKHSDYSVICAGASEP